jgi:hypothetical protein
MLQANGIYQGMDFVMQNTGSIFRNHPSLRKGLNAITDTANFANRIIGGGEELEDDLFN